MTEKIANFKNELDKIQKNSSRNSRSGLFASRANDAINQAYETVYDESWRATGEYKVRKGASQAALDAANKLIEMGVNEAVMGRGRDLLQR